MHKQKAPSLLYFCFFDLLLWNMVQSDAGHFSSPTGLPMCQEYSPKVFTGQDLYSDQGEDTLPEEEEEEDEDDRLSMVALETELQKYLAED